MSRKHKKTRYKKQVDGVAHKPKITKHSGIPTNDFMRNAKTGIGTSADKDFYNTFINQPRIHYSELEAMYINDWLSAKVVDAKPNDMIRSWRTVSGLNSDQLAAFNREESRFGIRKKIESSLKLARLYGGSAMYLGLPGLAQDEIDLARITQGQLTHINVLDSRELTPTRVNDDPLSPNFRLPEMYEINGARIHCSRLIVFRGVEVPRFQAPYFQYWGASIFQKIKEAISRVIVAYGAGSTMLHEASLDVISIQGLMHLLGDADGEGKIHKRMTMANLTKSVHNMTIKDVDEKFDKITHNFAGVPDMIREMLIAVSGASGIPMTRLAGISPSGLNATGEHDLINYYDTVASDQVLELTPVFDILDPLLQLNAIGSIDEDFTTIFNQLWEPTRGQQSEMDFKDVDSDLRALAYLPARTVLSRVRERNAYKMNSDTFEAQVAYLEENRERFLSQQVGSATETTNRSAESLE